nr:hypothetical protein Iba_chr01bCG12030 [Ipomoea batatas]
MEKSSHCYSPFGALGFRCALFWGILCVVVVVFNSSVHAQASRTLKDKSSVVSMATESFAAILERAYPGPSRGGAGHK